MRYGSVPLSKRRARTKVGVRSLLWMLLLPVDLLLSGAARRGTQRAPSSTPAAGRVVATGAGARPKLLLAHRASARTRLLKVGGGAGPRWTTLVALVLASCESRTSSAQRRVCVSRLFVDTAVVLVVCAGASKTVRAAAR